jgi:hypothetical protein
MSSNELIKRARRIKRWVDYLYRTGRADWAFPWAREWHRIAATLRDDHGIVIYGR